MSSRLDAKQLSASLNSFVKQSSVGNQTKLVENFEPKSDEGESYKVIYEALFESSSTSRIQVEIWLTDEGNFATGIETRNRVFSRLNKSHPKKRFAFGHEPEAVAFEDLLVFLEVLSNFDVQISLSKPLKHLRKLLVPREAYRKLANTFYAKKKWIGELSCAGSLKDEIYFKLPYEKWSNPVVGNSLKS